MDKKEKEVTLSLFANKINSIGIAPSAKVFLMKDLENLIDGFCVENKALQDKLDEAVRLLNKSFLLIDANLATVKDMDEIDFFLKKLESK